MSVFPRGNSTENEEAAVDRRTCEHARYMVGCQVCAADYARRWPTLPPLDPAGTTPERNEAKRSEARPPAASGVVFEPCGAPPYRAAGVLKPHSHDWPNGDTECVMRGFVHFVGRPVDPDNIGDAYAADDAGWYEPIADGLIESCTCGHDRAAHGGAHESCTFILRNVPGALTTESYCGCSGYNPTLALAAPIAICGTIYLDGFGSWHRCELAAGHNTRPIGAVMCSGPLICGEMDPETCAICREVPGHKLLHHGELDGVGIGWSVRPPRPPEFHEPPATALELLSDSARELERAHGDRRKANARANVAEARVTELELEVRRLVDERDAATLAAEELRQEVHALGDRIDRLQAEIKAAGSARKAVRS